MSFSGLAISIGARSYWSFEPSGRGTIADASHAISRIPSQAAAMASAVSCAEPYWPFRPFTSSSSAIE